MLQKSHPIQTVPSVHVPQDLIEELQIHYNDAQPWKRITIEVQYFSVSARCDQFEPIIIYWPLS